jgi:hypothetical protein
LGKRRRPTPFEEQKAVQEMDASHERPPYRIGFFDLETQRLADEVGAGRINT